MWTHRMGVEFESLGGTSTTLCCPHCRFNYMHQTNTAIYERTEDAERTTVMQQDGEEMVVTKFPSKETHNPSYRRRGLVIDFFCEQCEGKTYHLAIYQHKGNTILEWVE